MGLTYRVLYQVVLIGHSKGGYTNLELMEKFPQKIALAVFVSASMSPSGVPFHGSPVADLVNCSNLPEH
jgi:pimeloyl-ACP methyl ester carboxylesterase